ncbi:MAG: response regulator transcription factor [Caldilineales bacterium]
MKKTTILVADDDEMIVDVLLDQFANEGFNAVAAYDGVEALRQARLARPDLILLDVMMPKMQGWEVLRELRRDSTTPVLMLTARGEELDRVLGLELGADDYIVKPFSFRELLARVRATLRRLDYDRRDGALLANADDGVVEVGALAIDRRKHLVTRGDDVVALSQREYDLLIALLDADGAVVQRGDLLDQVWGEAWIGDPRTLDVHIRWLREKLEDQPSQPQLIRTVRGAGYRLVSPDELADDG